MCYMFLRSKLNEIVESIPKCRRNRYSITLNAVRKLQAQLSFNINNSLQQCEVLV